MKKLKRTIIYTAILLTVNCTLPTEILAQGPGFDPDVEDVPFDGGVTLIAAAAMAYGAKKLKNRCKTNK